MSRLVQGGLERKGKKMLDQYSPDQLNAFWSGVTGVAAVATGSIAILTLLSVRQDSRDRSRPVISVELLPIVLSKGTSELVVKNVGPAVAKNVRITFDPPVLKDMGQMAAFIHDRYSNVIPTMGPGLRLANVYGHWVGDGSNNLVEPVPMEFTVKACYEDAHGRDYADTYDLTLETLRNQTTSTPSNTDVRGMQKRWVQALEAIARGVDRSR